MLCYLPDTSTIPIVIPDSVDSSSILLKPILDGGLVITWSPITNVNYGNISYDIRVSYKDENCTAVSFLWIDVALQMKQNSVFFFYCFFFLNFRSSHVQVTTNARYTVPSHWKVSQYSEISIFIRAFTVWGSANISDVILRSPPSTPEIPLKPRAFVSFIRNESSVLTVSQPTYQTTWKQLISILTKLIVENRR